LRQARVAWSEVRLGQCSQALPAAHELCPQYRNPCRSRQALSRCHADAYDVDMDPLTLRVGSSNGISDLCNSSSGQPQLSCGSRVETSGKHRQSHALCTGVRWASSILPRRHHDDKHVTMPAPFPTLQTLTSVVHRTRTTSTATPRRQRTSGCNGTVQYLISRGSPTTANSAGSQAMNGRTPGFSQHAVLLHRQYRDGFNTPAPSHRNPAASPQTPPPTSPQSPQPLPASRQGLSRLSTL